VRYIEKSLPETGNYVYYYFGTHNSDAKWPKAFPRTICKFAAAKGAKRALKRSASVPFSTVAENFKFKLIRQQPGIAQWDKLR